MAILDKGKLSTFYIDIFHKDGKGVVEVTSFTLPSHENKYGHLIYF